MNIRNYIRSIAKTTRAWADKVAPKHGIPKDLNCFCAIGAKRLYKDLKKAGLRAWIAVNDTDEFDSHVFVVCNGYIVDITASQFGESDIFIKKIGSEPLSKHWNMNKIFNSERAFTRYLKETDWPLEQITLKTGAAT